MIGQAVQAGRVSRREHYYKVLERTEDILSRCNELGDIFYEFHEASVKLANAKPVGMDESLINDFITRFQGRLTTIHLSQRLFYPGIEIDTVPVRKTADELVLSAKEMWELARATGTDAEGILLAAKVRANHKRRESIFASFASELGIVMTSMVVSLNKQARKLRIRAEPITVDRTKLPGSSLESEVPTSAK